LSAWFSRPTRVAPDLDLAVDSLHLRHPLQRRVDRGGQGPDGHSRALQQRAGPSIGLAQHRRQHVHGLDVLVIVARRNRLRVGERLLKLGGQAVLSHGTAPFRVPPKA